MSRLALARIDLRRLALSAEVFTNWMPRVVGSMMIRPGLQYILGTRANLKAKYLDHVFATDDTALVELTDGTMRVAIDDVIITRPAVTSTFFRWNSGGGGSWDTSTDTDSPMTTGDVDYWKNNDEAGAVSAFATGDYLSLVGTGRTLAIRDRKVDVSVASANVEHSLNIVVNRGNVTLRIGSSGGGEEYLSDRTLRPGYHSISVTPSADFFIRFSNYAEVAGLVDSVTIQQAAADMTLVTPWLEADLDNVRWTQSGDVIFVACDGFIQKRIERQGASSPRSWSLVDYLADDGPFGDLNVGPVRLKGSAITGEITLTAEREFFKTSHVGALFELTSKGQATSKRLQAADTWSDYVRVVGVGNSRAIAVQLLGPTFTNTTTVRVQRSAASPGDWVDVSGWSWTAVLGTTQLIDGLDNQIIYYRIGIKTAEYTALDDITANLEFAGGSKAGIVRVTDYSSATAVSGSVLKPLGKLDQYTDEWRESDWSPRKGWPSAVELDNGRLFWSGKAMTWGSVSDQFDSFDDTVEGDSGPIRRQIGKGPVDTVNWMLGGENLLLGLQGSVLGVRSSTLDEPITQAKYHTVPVSSTGTAAVPAALVDNSVVFVGRNTHRAYETAIEPGASNYSPPADLTAIVPELGTTGFTRLAVQRSPDTRLHFLRSDGKVAVLVREKLENVACWLLIETDGVVEDIIVLPGRPATPSEDRVYYVVQRTIDGATVRYLEKWAVESNARGLAINRIADSFVFGTLAGTTTVSGLDHLEGKEVCLWGNTKDLGTYTVVSGAITSTVPITGPYCAGLPYVAQWKSAKLMVAGHDMPFGKAKRIVKLTLVAADMHAQGLQYGQSFDLLDDLPLVEEGATVDGDSIWTDYTYDAFPLNGVYEEDARLCLQATAPRPATVLAVAIE